VLGVFLIVPFSGGTFLSCFRCAATSDNRSELSWLARIGYFWHLTLPGSAT
jgi:ABC-type microcin C transport system permease subunit YejB